jgi:hypothetical protein
MKTLGRDSSCPTEIRTGYVPNTNHVVTLEPICSIGFAVLGRLIFLSPLGLCFN